MFCKLCGKEIPDGQELCEECKAKNNENIVVDDTTVNENTTQENTTSSEEIPVKEATVVNNNQTNPNAKSKIAAGLLGIFLGSLGIHNFYLGYTGKAIAQLLISLLSCGTLAVVSEIWGLIEGIMILTESINTDANGNPLKD